MLDNSKWKFIIPAIIMAIAPSAFANEQLCADIENRLKGGQLSIGTGPQTRALTQEINTLNGLIRTIRSDMRRSGCSVGSVIVYGDRNAELCAELGERLVEATSEINYLNEQKKQLQFATTGRLSQSERRKLEQQWERSGCLKIKANQAQKENDLKPAQPAEKEQASTNAPKPMVIDPMNKSATGAGNLRTMCVRLCDGKFYPVSANASPLDFTLQKAQCQNSCPSSDTDLYYHSTVGQETKDMVSATTNQSYASLPTAYKFQQASAKKQDDCSCGALGSVEFGEKPRDAASLPTPSDDGTSTSENTPDAETKSETAEPPKQEAKVDEGRPYVPGERKVRTVGPQFFPEDNSIDLKNPASPGAQPQQF